VQIYRFGCLLVCIFMHGCGGSGEPTNQGVVVARNTPIDCVYSRETLLSLNSKPLGYIKQIVYADSTLSKKAIAEALVIWQSCYELK